jgi:hypothetical protein
MNIKKSLSDKIFKIKLLETFSELLYLIHMVGKIQIIIDCSGSSFPSFLALKHIFYSKTQVSVKTQNWA